MNALQAVGLGLSVILAGMAMIISITLWPLGVAVALGGLTLLLLGGLFGHVRGETKPPSRPAQT